MLSEPIKLFFKKLTSKCKIPYCNVNTHTSCNLRNAHLFLLADGVNVKIKQEEEFLIEQLGVIL